VYEIIFFRKNETNTLSVAQFIFTSVIELPKSITNAFIYKIIFHNFIIRVETVIASASGVAPLSV